MAKRGKSDGDQSKSHADDGLIALVHSLPAPAEFAARLLTLVPQAQKIKTYLAEIARLPDIDETEQAQLLESLRRKDDRTIRKRLNEANIRLVAWIAKEYAGADLLLSDLITEGTIGLLNAIDTYDATTGQPFKLYAASCIRQAVSQAVAYETSQNRVPAYLLEKIESIKPISQRLTAKIGREPTRQEVAKELGMSADELDRLVQLVRQVPDSSEQSSE